MTILIGGADTGVLNSSLNTTGIANRVGDGGGDTDSAMFVNVSNGNLVYRHEDSFLTSQGADFGLVRTYNARAQMGDASGFGDGRWRLSTAVSLSPRVQQGETYYQVTWGDGSVSDYRFDASSNTYISTDGAGSYERLTIASDGSASLLRADQSTRSFDAQGRLTGSVDTNGVSMAYAYNADLLTTVTDDTGHVITFSYSNGRLASVVAVSQGDDLRTSTVESEFSTTLVTYTYDGSGRLSTVTDRRGDVTTYVYNAEGYLETVTLPSSFQDTDGNVATDLARTLSFGYETVRWSGGIAGPSKVVSSITQGDQTSTISYNFTLGPVGSSTGQLYNQGAATITDHLGNTLTYHFDTRGNVTKTIDQLGYQTVYTYDADNNLTRVTDRNGFGAVNSDSTYYQTLRQKLGYATLVAGLSDNDKTALTEAFTSHFTYDASGNLTHN